jgi:uncharacterized protein YcnI
MLSLIISSLILSALSSAHPAFFPATTTTENITTIFRVPYGLNNTSTTQIIIQIPDSVLSAKVCTFYLNKSAQDLHRITA